MNTKTKEYFRKKNKRAWLYSFSFMAEIFLIFVLLTNLFNPYLKVIAGLGLAAIIGMSEFKLFKHEMDNNFEEVE